MSSRSCWGALATLLAAPLAAQQLGPVDRARLAAGVWAEARYNLPAWDRVRADWDSGFTAVLASTGARQSDLTFFRRLRRFVALLADGQSAILPPATVGARLARPPMVLRAIERRAFLVNYQENDELRVARPEPNAEVLAVQGIATDQWIRDSVLPEIAAGTERSAWDRAIAHMLDGEKGTAVHLQLRLPGGAERGASVTRSVSITDRWPLDPPALEVDTLPGAVVRVRITSFVDLDLARRFDRALPDFAGVRGLILDLRDHEGMSGGREAGYAILGRLTDRPLVASRWRTPLYRPAYRGQDMPDSNGGWFVAPPDTIPRRHDLPVYDGPVAVLSSSRTSGAAEDLLVAFRNAGRGPVVGERSAGSNGQVALFRLMNGWRLRLTVTREEFPDGASISGVGVAPEQPVEVTVEDFLAGRDVALERAREYITGRLLAPGR